MKAFKIAPRRDFALFIVLGSLACLAAILFCPLWAKTDLPWATWGTKIIQLLIAACLIAYLCTYLWKKVTRGGNGVIRVLTVIEFVCLALIALGCILSQFKVFNISGACAIFGLCLFCRGTVEIFRAYYYQRGSSTRYPVWWLAVAIAMVAFGTYCFARPLFTDVVVLWIFVLALLVVGLCAIFYGVACRPKKKSK